jgi:hypothetical protein
MGKPILCVDFDGVIHSYTSGWKGADVIPDPPVDGAMEFLLNATEKFRVAIFSSRSNQPGGLGAMQRWLTGNLNRYVDDGSMHDRQEMEDKRSRIEWPLEKPAAMVTLDDRAITFSGTWPSVESLLAFQPWNKRELGATGTFSDGRLNEDDQGDLKMAISRDVENNLVRFDFGKPVAWMAMKPEQAIDFARHILKYAGAS